eukprot:TRINITY_DN7244_c0_g1_i1.p1 TRINITY_DN7244_c0_g1~~TRINITY_DN7244_c0_g1_i1.p1  ORF type:complete len:316 (-),score=64.55 TRINITY_DN7244_c0_g1_i1:171-1118(-)
MVKEWIVKSGRHKATHFRKDAVGDNGDHNVLGMVKNGESVYGEFLFIRRASRETGFINVRHLEQQGGSSWLVRGADGTSSTLVSKHPQDSHDISNAVGYAMEGELVEGEYLFCMRRGEKRGGYVKVKHLRPAKERKLPELCPDPEEFAKLAAGLRSKPTQRWAVMDSNHDGAWLRKQPSSDRSRQNILCLVMNGTVVDGEFMFVSKAESGEKGFLRFCDLEQQGATSWRVRRARSLLRQPRKGEDAANIVCTVSEGERVDGEHVFVSCKNGKHEGFIKRSYLTALELAEAVEQAAERGREDAPAKRARVSTQEVM